MGYIEKHRKMMTNSLKLDSLAFKLLMIDISFILTLMLVYGIIYSFWIKNLWSVSAVLGIEGNMPTLSEMDMLTTFNAFITKIILLIVVSIILYLILISLYSAFSHKFINNKGFTLKLFLNFLGIYSILTLIYMIILVLVLLSLPNALVAAWFIIIATLLYLYLLLIFYLVTSSGKFMKIVRHGLKSMIRLHDIVLPLITAFMLTIIILIVLGLLLAQWPVLLTIFAVIAFLYLSIWLRRYMYQIVH